jgi:hypothetical protein
LIGAPEDDIVERVPVDGCVAFQERFDGYRRKIIGSHGPKRTSIAADGRANRVTNISSGHGMMVFPRRQSTVNAHKKSKCDALEWKSGVHSAEPIGNAKRDREC